MKRVIYYFSLLCLLSCSSHKQEKEISIGRTTDNFNYNWKFQKGDISNAEKKNFDDALWRNLDLPHDWSVEEPFSKEWASCTGYLPGGIGWYRKTFFLPSEAEGRKFYICFDGIYNNSTVWINGKKLGTRPNGFIAFQYNLTNHLIYGGKNVIAVKVNHSKYADSRWYTGSGIYRDVKLLSMYPLHIKQWGIYAVTPQANDKKAIVKIEVSVINELERACNFDIINYLVYGNDTIGNSTKTVELQSSKESCVMQNIEVPQPRLWDTEHPHLYKLITQVKLDGKVVDYEITNIGIRDIKFSVDSGFQLNKKSLKLKGVCIHEDAGCLGTAVPRQVIERRLSILKEMGCNAIRLSHNQYSQQFMDVCDEMGFLVIDEAFDEWELPKRKWIYGWNKGAAGQDGYSNYFKKWHQQDLTNQVLRDRNHPCVILWSIGNEIDYPTDPYTHLSLNRKDNPIPWARYDPNLPDGSCLGKIAEELTAIVKELDPSRSVTAGLANSVMAAATGYIHSLDVSGYNYQEKAYEPDHIKYPDRVMFASEATMSIDSWRFVQRHTYFIGQFLWKGIDFIGEAYEFPYHTKPTGIIDMAGFKKTEFYFRQSLWSDRTMLHLATCNLSRAGMTDTFAHKNYEPYWNYREGQKIKVCAFTNCEEVELFLNNLSLGSKKLRDFPLAMIDWDVKYKKGILKAIGKVGGKPQLIYELKTAGEASKLVCMADCETLKANRQDVSHIEVTITDKNEIAVYNSENEISCKTSGPIRLIGIEDSNPINTEPYKGNKRKTFHGKALVYIQSLHKPGKATVELTSNGMKPVIVTFNVIK